MLKFLMPIALIRAKSREKKRERFIKNLNRAVAILGALNAIATLPQVYEIWINKDAAGVSEFSWGYYCMYTTVLLIYGIVNKQKPIVIAYTFSLISYVMVFVGSVIY